MSRFDAFVEKLKSAIYGLRLLASDRASYNPTALSENWAILSGECHEAFGQLDDFSG